MSRYLTLSRAARLVGVRRAELQRRISRGELQTFEGMLSLAELQRVYPEVRLDDDAMLERMSRIMDEALSRVRGGSETRPAADTLAARLEKLGRELAEARAQAARHQELCLRLRDRIASLARVAPENEALAGLQHWFEENLDALSPGRAPREPDTLAARDAMLSLMAAHVRLLPSGHDFFVEGSESLLQAALRAGLAVPYGCADGRCGRCQARLVGGRIRALESGARAGDRFLLCRCTAGTDLTVRVDEATAPDDLPQQEIRARLARMEEPAPGLLVVGLRPPASTRLRFLAGQDVVLSPTADPECRERVPVASCPCQERELEFHLRSRRPDDLGARLREQGLVQQSLMVSGPLGDFVLDPGSPRPLLFVARDEAFGAVRGLIEATLAQDAAEQIRLLWIADPAIGHYQERQLRSWADALPNFDYRALLAPAADLPELPALATLGLATPEIDAFVAAPGAGAEALCDWLRGEGVDPGHIRMHGVATEGRHGR